MQQNITEDPATWVGNSSFFSRFPLFFSFFLLLPFSFLNGVLQCRNKSRFFPGFFFFCLCVCVREEVQKPFFSRRVIYLPFRLFNNQRNLSSNRANAKYWVWKLSWIRLSKEKFSEGKKCFQKLYHECWSERNIVHAFIADSLLQNRQKKTLLWAPAFIGVVFKRWRVKRDECAKIKPHTKKERGRRFAQKWHRRRMTPLAQRRQGKRKRRQTIRKEYGIWKASMRSLTLSTDSKGYASVQYAGPVPVTHDATNLQIFLVRWGPTRLPKIVYLL